MSVLLTFFVFLLMITALVASHEYGHFLFARIFGMEVEEFAIGMGKPVWVWMRRKGTEYTVRPLPIGGFVRIKGMVPQEDGGETQIEDGFYSKPPLARLCVLFAGPLFSVLAGLTLLVGLFTIIGEHVKTPLLGQLVDGDPAQKAGLQMGDMVLSVNGKPVQTWYEMQDLIWPNPGRRLNLQVKRGNQILTKSLVSIQSQEPEQRIDEHGNPVGRKELYGMIGVHASVRVEPVAFSQALSDACEMPVDLVAGLFSIVKHPDNFGEMMGGPGTIAVATYDATQEGSYQVILLAAVLSISIGVLNLLPIFPLDGGQMAVAFAELLRRRRLSIRTQGAVQTVGMALIGMLIVSVLWVDVRRLSTPADPPPKAPATSAPTRNATPAEKQAASAREVKHAASSVPVR